MYKQQQGWVDYPMNMVLQMIGRAGRPQYDSEGVAVVLTDTDSSAKFESILSGMLPIERSVGQQAHDSSRLESSLTSLNFPPLATL